MLWGVRAGVKQAYLQCTQGITFGIVLSHNSESFQCHSLVVQLIWGVVGSTG